MKLYNPFILSEKNAVIIAYLLLAAVFVAGLFVPLMDNDAGEYALISLNMTGQNDFINIIRKGQDYLDKPHLLFWLSAISFKIFGVHGWAYKLPSLIFSCIAIYSTTRLGIILFNKKTGILAGLILGYSQAFIIANYDVRTDAILTGATIYSIYQFISFASDKKYRHILLGALGLALAVGTKGLIAVIVTGLVIVLHMFYHRRIKELFNWRWLSTILWFFIFLSPFLFCYYLQFDAHPEKITNGVKGMSGIKFLLWTQSFERLAGQRNMVNNSDPIFFFHTFLWAFLPWSLIAYYETFRDWIITVKNKFSVRNYIQFSISGTALLIMLLMSTSQFKLPHYLNIIFPLFALITAKSVFRLIDVKNSIPAWIGISLYMVCGVYISAGILLNVWSFPLNNTALIFTAIASIAFLIFIILKMPSSLQLKPIFITMLTGGIVNFILNTNFFPKVLSYQGSSRLAEFVNGNNIPKDNIIGFTHRSYYAFDFYIQKDIPEPGIGVLKQRAANNESFYVLTDKEKMAELTPAAISMQTVKTVPHYHVSTLKAGFLNPLTRAASLDSLWLLKVN